MLLTVAAIKRARKAPAVAQAAAAIRMAPSATLSSVAHKGARPNTDTQEVAARAPADAASAKKQQSYLSPHWSPLVTL